MKAINSLIKEKKTVSYRTISEKTKEIDPEGLGIHPNTIHNNQELYEYYLSSRSTSLNKPLKRSRKPLNDKLESIKYIKLDRDINQVRQRYMKLTKPELVDSLIRMEQYVAQQNQQWLKSEFEKFED
ncbi:hypothetical protein D1872_246920 [compost metagenome]